MIARLKFWWSFTGILLVLGLFYKFKGWLLEYARNNTLQLLIWVAVLIGVLLLVMLVVFLLGRKKPKPEAAAEDEEEADEDEAEEPEKEPEEGRLPPLPKSLRSASYPL
ncbi:MAG: hypothetical protein [Olavius algarvensis Delta 4 endosymbiont]|nr:MAG: hypothetical protein [Olavius algarvensis Delta 4 endosymbiont]